MNENIKKFLSKVEKSPELQAQFSKIRNPDEAYKLASTVQDGFTKEEFVTEMTKLYATQTVDLSDEEITKVAGGGWDNLQRSMSNSFVTGHSSMSLSYQL